MASDSHLGGPNNGESSVVDPSLNPSSHYYVDPSDGPSTIAVTPPLNGNNYHAWACSMRRVLIVKNKFRFVDGSVPVPTIDDPSYSAWERCNALVHLWLMNSVSSSIGQSIIYVENAIDVWTDLKERFGQVDLIRIFELQQEIYNLKQGSMNVTEYFTILKTLCGEFENYRPIPNCTCTVKCGCDAARNARLYRDQDYIIGFLRGLNERFSLVRSQILLMEPLPTLNKAFSMVLLYERIARLDDSRALINATDTRKAIGRGRGASSDYGNRNTNKVCSFCGKNGHRVETCYRRHGFPPGYQFRNHSSAINNLIHEEVDYKQDEVPMEDVAKVDTPVFIQNTSSITHSSNQVESFPHNDLMHGNGSASTGYEMSEDDWFE